MKRDTINKLCCPFDKNDLDLTVVTKDTTENILEGFFTCKECRRIYPIVRGIPIMNPDEYREFSLEKPLLDKWNKQLEGKKIENFRLIEE
ncbi:hypothetical protein OO013_02775 [Mangrovivirga sp. M17]|uniref:Trm112 family protein n=1 Tax=Mangrovivirga halotolerans TaxID=2993936 RepID=A0ABT3RMG8_9BACT|nr:Trm112 family protein [Mangrovivirga halotolerans]MCX2742771.1 hypothetical protein [Mangrovivirga halotolerans]